MGASLVRAPSVRNDGRLSGSPAPEKMISPVRAPCPTPPSAPGSRLRGSLSSGRCRSRRAPPTRSLRCRLPTPRPKPDPKAICLRPYRPARQVRRRTNFRFSMVSFVFACLMTGPNIRIPDEFIGILGQNRSSAGNARTSGENRTFNCLLHPPSRPRGRPRGSRPLARAAPEAIFRKPSAEPMPRRENLFEKKPLHPGRSPHAHWVFKVPNHKNRTPHSFRRPPSAVSRSTMPVMTSAASCQRLARN